MELTRVIYTLLHQNQNVAGQVGTRIFPDILAGGHPLPAITFTVNNISRTQEKDSQQSYDEADITVTVYARKRETAENIAEYCTTAMNRKSQTINNTTVHTTGHTGESWDVWDRGDAPGTEGIGQRVFLQSINYYIHYTYVPK